MSEVVIFRHPEKPLELFIDTDDIHGFEAPVDVRQVPCDAAGCPGCGFIHRTPTTAHLNLTFKPGKRALWREVAAATESTG